MSTATASGKLNRFVLTEFIRTLGKNVLTEISPEDQVERQVRYMGWLRIKGRKVPVGRSSVCGHLAFAVVVAHLPRLVYWLLGTPLTTEEMVATITISWLILNVINLAVMP